MAPADGTGLPEGRQVNRRIFVHDVRGNREPIFQPHGGRQQRIRVI
ncbi:UNVERIFIED_ORG: hypothetical protein GGE44_000569 [Rhizobium esperanzae]